MPEEPDVTRRTGRLARGAVSALLCLAATTGCGGAGEAGGAARKDGAAREADGTAPRPLTAREKSLLYDAEQTLVQQCMREAGFRLWKTPENPLPEHRDFPYAVDDADWAREHGYGSGLRQRVERLRAEDPNRRYLQGLSPQRRQAAVTALNGTDPQDGPHATLPMGAQVSRSSEGCTSAAQRELYGDLDAWFTAQMITDTLPSIRRARVLDDAAYTTAVGKWSSCMRRRGHDHADPGEARAAFAEPHGTAPSRREVRTAVDEAECAADSGLAATARRLDRHHGRRLDEQYRGEIRDRTRLERAALPRARSAVRAG
ncbi:hypothetical protein GQS52_21915 [Streptomyces sp. SCUT-3]|uniref:hypothetical protein n=1 Tax=Streptomyces sp. SCUT-3 TaxID=2684469 RepID=UPI0015F8246B|nr:hypothetical protein [Streptomyces sp. SCUT-3]QMV24002.1 hypothetical protein GQS52_21915 [Streptomyces sp. SCUT-3]